MEPAAIHHEFIIIIFFFLPSFFTRAGARTTPRTNSNTRPGPNRMARTTTPEAKPAAVGQSRTRRQNRTNRHQFVRANPSLFLFNSASRARTRTAGRRQPQFARQEHDAHKPSPKIPLSPRKNTAAKRATIMNAKGTRGEKESKIGEEEDPEPGGRGGSTCLERHRPERMMGRQRDDMAPAGGGRAIFVAKKASDRWRGRRRRVSSGFAAVRFEREQGRENKNKTGGRVWLSVWALRLLFTSNRVSPERRERWAELKRPEPRQWKAQKGPVSIHVHRPSSL